MSGSPIIQDGKIIGAVTFEEVKGALTEQFVAQQLKASDRELYYYSTENSSGEIDFVIQQEMLCVPIEVKAEENLRARSLRAFCDKYKPEIAVRSSMSNYREQDWMVNVPLYVFDKYLKDLGTFMGLCPAWSKELDYKGDMI